MRGFSLVELSIVLVILGLLTGGILTGQNLIRAAELRAAVTEYQRYSAAIQTFRGKYMALPGDMTNAEAFWGSMPTGTCPYASGGTGTQTCSGDGDGIISAGGSAGANLSNERFTLWQHLANAGLIEGTYTGIAGPGGTLDSVYGENVPGSRISNAVWFADADGGSTSVYFDIDYRNSLLLGVDSSSGNNRPNSAVMTPAEAWGIDKKIDDGQPARGKLVAGIYATCTDAADQDDLDAAYLLDSTATACNLVFPRLF
jgi:prepilin-type N-terminal cleavage/methylation domain-containing protein